ncbi:hypothetical protein PCC7424_1879 [Gloeothece citriformis PCC 7424]|uniref:Uncharacterized protein n=1 Tax=Gloeothece citriformis (strain PCC 7424) TaxID=65393 RepID=B7KDK9_GLOC7|nr:hypothetical protein [Gloeothece citriformis]ACK70311.1 hypothetical protein PCC7424_1879 [Gloeothece citriformis PCC 7424]
MARRRKYNVSPNQLSLEDLPGFWEIKSESKPSEKEASLKASSYVAKESSQNYQTVQNQKMSPDIYSNNQLQQAFVPIEIAFDVSQGIRDAKQFWLLNKKPEIEVIFDGRHLDLAQYYVAGKKEIFHPEEQYLSGKGGLINIATFFNVFRCKKALNTWSENEYKKTGIYPIKNFKFIPPQDRAVGQLWNNLGMPDPYSQPSSEISHFRSQYITPLLWVDQLNENQIFLSFKNWTNKIYKRIGCEVRKDIEISVIPEIITNLIKYGFKKTGLFCVCVWPSGQIEILWSNSIYHLTDWPPERTAYGLAEALQQPQTSGGGQGMAYIYDKLLPKYNGVLEVNCRDIDLCFYSEGCYEVLGQGAISEEFLPESILFTLHLFCQETRKKNEHN